jgi:enoyl-CoA hydratase/carnithine racemase
MSELVALERLGAVAIATVDNPPVNAMTDETLEALGDVAAAIAGDEDVRAAVLAGAGERVFLAGADLRELASTFGDRAAIERHVGLTARVLGQWSALAVPTIAAVRGNALGGGLETALACDFVYAGARAKFGLPEVGLGLIPGAGGTQRLPRRVGTAPALRMILAAEIVDAARALEIGLVDYVAAEDDPVAAATVLAETLAARPAVAVRAAKAVVRRAAEEPLAAGLVAERALFVEVTASADAAEGARAFLEKRSPEFRHR